MEISAQIKLTKEGQKLILLSPTYKNVEELLSFLVKIQTENPNQRTLVGNYPQTLQDFSLVMEQVSSSRNDLLIIAMLNDMIVGIVDFYDSTIDTDPHPIAEIGVSVLKKFQGKGIATVLMKTCIDTAKKHSSIRTIILTVLSEKIEAKRLYTKLGFVDTIQEQITDKFWMELRI